MGGMLPCLGRLAACRSGQPTSPTSSVAFPCRQDHGTAQPVFPVPRRPVPSCTPPIVRGMRRSTASFRLSWVDSEFAAPTLTPGNGPRTLAMRGEGLVAILRVGRRGQVTLPVEIRQALGVAEGRKMVCYVNEAGDRRHRPAPAACAAVDRRSRRGPEGYGGPVAGGRPGTGRHRVRRSLAREPAQAASGRRLARRNAGEGRLVMERWLLDTNLIIYLLAPDQAPSDSIRERVRGLFERAARGEATLVVTPVVVFETLLVLMGFDLHPREAARLVERVLAWTGVECEDEAHVLYALSRLSKKLDFVGGYLASRSHAEPYRVASNDRDLRRLGARMAER
ncbi:AbrB/MazE/SpoVT family DNA-binding domain-containing protein [Thermaerobacter sp. FW80]|nr:AbrB/MazE/SpoVT family DNA-binding domain-containing protein [Thermaerobacter sp. FW80]